MRKIVADTLHFARRNEGVYPVEFHIFVDGLDAQDPVVSSRARASAVLEISASAVQSGPRARHFHLHPARAVDIDLRPGMRVGNADRRPHPRRGICRISDRITRGNAQRAVYERCGARVVLADAFPIIL